MTRQLPALLGGAAPAGGLHVASSGTGDKGYVTGDGQVVQRAARSSVRQPIDAVRRGPRRRAARPRGLPRQAGRGRGVGRVVRALPRRGPGGGRRRPRSSATDAQFVGINLRDSSAPEPGLRAQRSTCRTPRSTRPTGRRCSPSRGSSTPNSIPSFVVLDAEGRVAASDHRRAAVDAPRWSSSCEDVARGDRGWVSGSPATAGSGSLAAGHPGGAGRRAGVVLLAVRDPAAAGLPLLRHRAVRCRPRGAPSGAGCWPARCCSCSASRSSSSRSARCPVPSARG